MNLYKRIYFGGLLSLCLCLFSISYVEAKSSDKIVSGNNGAIRYVGRTIAHMDGSVSFDWVGTYFETKFTGDRISIQLSETGTSYYNVFVDKKLHKVVKACGTDTIINFVSGVGRGLHNLTIQKRTEGEFGKTTIHKFHLAPSGDLKIEHKTRNRHIEFIGNSLTCGYGVEGKDKNDPFKLETENCNLSFSTIIARYFNADYSLLAHSGLGAVRNYGDSVRVSAITMKDKMLQTFDMSSIEKWNYSSYHPDLVVINLGTNDFSLEPQPYKSEFIKAYKQILTQLREGYGQIPIICIYSCTIPAPVYNYYEAVIAEMNDSNIHLIKLNNELLDERYDYGAVWHPNYSGHRKTAMSLIPIISTLMRWEMIEKRVE